MQKVNIAFGRRLHTNAKNGFTARVLNSFSLKDDRQPPYTHFVQMGDPVLRTTTKPVDLNRITSTETQNIINNMRIVLEDYDAFGVSAPQIGVPLSIFALQCTEQQICKSSSDTLNTRGMVETPFKVFINPKVKPVGETNIVDREGCCSMNQYSANVSRHKEVVVSAYNEKGEPVTWNAKDWNARIVQHEMDHLNGILFIDKLHSSESLEFNYWRLVNIRQGDFRLNFGQISGWRQYLYVLPILFMIPLVIIMAIGKS